MVILLPCLFYCFIVTPLFAHHSTARYDLSKTVVVQGTVTEVLWQNPHVILVMNDTKGQEQAFEAPSPTYIVNSGWMKDTIKPGAKVTVKGNPAKNGQLPMYLVTITCRTARNTLRRIQSGNNELAGALRPSPNPLPEGEGFIYYLNTG